MDKVRDSHVDSEVPHRCSSDGFGIQISWCATTRLQEKPEVFIFPRSIRFVWVVSVGTGPRLESLSQAHSFPSASCLFARPSSSLPVVAAGVSGGPPGVGAASNWMLQSIGYSSLPCSWLVELLVIDIAAHEIASNCSPSTMHFAHRMKSSAHRYSWRGSDKLFDFNKFRHFPVL